MDVLASFGVVATILHTAAIARLPDYAIFSSYRGAGPIFAPRLLTAFGEDRERYQRCEELRKYAGIAPVTARSGQKSCAHWLSVMVAISTRSLLCDCSHNWQTLSQSSRCSADSDATARPCDTVEVPAA